uniref:SVWC domain-containing protein n=1 Tax=Anopheles minimus TaxID=112268 RepID=A0A182W5X5_9DIPT
MKPAINRLVPVALALFVCLASISDAYVFIIPDAKSPNQKDHCYDEATKILVPVNEDRQRPNRCETMSCGDDYSLHVAGCGAIAAGPGMIITKTDFSKPYPDCCPKLAMSAENIV